MWSTVHGMWWAMLECGGPCWNVVDINGMRWKVMECGGQ